MKSFQLTKNSTFFITIFCLIASQVFAQDNLNSQKPIHVTDASWSSLKDAIQEAKILPEDVVGVGDERTHRKLGDISRRRRGGGVGDFDFAVGAFSSRERWGRGEKSGEDGVGATHK